MEWNQDKKIPDASILLMHPEHSARRGWDSNPRALADKRFSRPPRYDHFDTSANFLKKSKGKGRFCQ